MDNIIEILEDLLDSSSMSCTRKSNDSVDWYIDGVGTVTLKITDISEE